MARGASSPRFITCMKGKGRIALRCDGERRALCILREELIKNFYARIIAFYNFSSGRVINFLAKWVLRSSISHYNRVR